MGDSAWWVTTVALAVAGQLVVAGCGGGASSKDASADQASKAGASPDADLGADAASCPALPCLAGATSLIASCAPSGTCTEQVTVSGGMATMAKCFANGVKISVTGTNLASGGTSTVMTVEKGGATCYSFTAVSDGASAGSVVYESGAGADLITSMVSGATETFTCPGGSAVVPDGSCDAALLRLQGLYPFTNAAGCTTGTCAF
jgi:hypothetical protein